VVAHDFEKVAVGEIEVKDSSRTLSNDRNFPVAAVFRKRTPIAFPAEALKSPKVVRSWNPSQ
jgi:hypothetical protein